MPIAFNNTLPAARVRELLSYDADSGFFTWNQSRGSRAKGVVAGNVNTSGAVQIQIDGEVYVAHRLAWLYVTGSFPPDEIDHRDGDPANNRWANLRPATHIQNAHNRRRPKSNRSGFKGVCWHKDMKKWQASIRAGQLCLVIGYYEKPEEAHAAYLVKAKELHGAFARAA